MQWHLLQGIKAYHSSSIAAMALQATGSLHTSFQPHAAACIHAAIHQTPSRNKHHSHQYSVGCQHGSISSQIQFQRHVQWRSFASSAHQEPADAASLLEAPVITSPQACRVVVVGWMGSRKRYLEKYSQLWQRSGDHEVLTLKTTIPMTLLRWRGVVKAGTDIDRVARMHMENPNMPTIYHIFSTGGFIHAGTMWRWMDQVEDHVLRQDLLGEVRGMIFDSGPAKVEAGMAANAIASAVLREPAGSHSARSQLLTPRIKAALDWYLQSRSVKLREQEVYEAWNEMAPVCPQLYLYSDADPLVPPEDVEEFMKQQEERGAEVFSHRWPDSGHVEHYRKYPHDYAFQVSQFMSHCLKDW